MQSSMLTHGRAEQSRGSLREALRVYFDAIDADGSGTLDESELRAAFECMGMGGKIKTREEKAAEEEAPPPMEAENAQAMAQGALPAPRPLEQMPPRVAELLRSGCGVFGGLDGASGVELTFDDFAALVEEALAECGFEARKRWKKGVAKLAGIRKLSALARMNVG